MMTEASDTMLVAATGGADAFWRASTWYLSILAGPGGHMAATGPQAGPAKMEKMEKIIVRMKKILVRMEKNLVKVERVIVYS